MVFTYACLEVWCLYEQDSIISVCVSCARDICASHAINVNHVRIGVQCSRRALGAGLAICCMQVSMCAFSHVHAHMCMLTCACSHMFMAYEV
jgi:hypothetical protein